MFIVSKKKPQATRQDNNYRIIIIMMICLMHFILGIQKSGFGECQSKKSCEGGWGGILMDSKPEKARKYTTLPPHTESFKWN